MNSREKFLSVMEINDGNYEKNAEVPKIEFGFWAGTIRRWAKEGLPLKNPIPEDITGTLPMMANKSIYGVLEKSVEDNVRPYFGLDYYLSKFPADYSPMLKPVNIEQTEQYKIYKDQFGVTLKININASSHPMEIENPVKDWKTWNKYKENYSEDTIYKRLPPNWEMITKNLKNRDFPIRLGGTPAGFLGFPRKILGYTNYLMKLYDDPALINDICDTFLEFLIKYYSKILEKIEVDCMLIWEDLSGKSGSVISPDHFKKFLTPRYKKLIQHFKNLGVKHFLVDTDGYVEDIIPLFIDAGFTGMYPFERAAGNDLLRIRKNFPEFQIMGGIDKRILFKNSNKERIDKELKIVKRMLKYGRYIPHIDHLVSEDCTWENFRYYRERLNNIIDNC